MNTFQSFRENLRCVGSIEESVGIYENTSRYLETYESLWKDVKNMQKHVELCANTKKYVEICRTCAELLRKVTKCTES